MSMIFSVFISCEKDSLQHDANANLQEDILKKGSRQGCSIEGISRMGDKLVFKDMEHFVATLECLELELEEHNQNFENQYAHLSDDEYNAFAENIGFNDFLPLEEFEQSLNFSSRREFIEEKIQAWLDTDNLDLENDPDDLDDFSVELRTLLSVKGEVVIGGKTINFLSEIDDTKTDNCRLYKKDKNWTNFDNNRKKFKLKVVAVSLPMKIKQKAKVKVIKQRNGRGWKRYRTNLFVQVGGFVRDFDCNFPLATGAVKGVHRRAELKAKRVNWDPPTRAKYKSREIFGFCDLPDYGISNTIVLSW